MRSISHATAPRSIPFNIHIAAYRAFRRELIQGLRKSYIVSPLLVTGYCVPLHIQQRNALFVLTSQLHQVELWEPVLSDDGVGRVDERYYAAAEELVREIGARPHLGKYCEHLTAKDLAKLHGDSFTKFQNFMAKHDPDGKFANGFTQRLFGSPPSPD